MAKQILCNMCLADGKITEMLYDKKSRYYVCPVCKTAIVPAENGDKYIDDIIGNLMREKYRSNLPWTTPIPAGQAKKGGGNGNGKGRSRKGDMNKKSLAQINSSLRGTCIAFDC